MAYINEVRHIPFVSRKGPIVSAVIDQMNIWTPRSSSNSLSDKETLMRSKLHHTGRVVSITDQLLTMMNGTIEGSNEPWNVPLAQTIAWCHDIARFEEIATQGKVNGDEKFNHSHIGAERFSELFINKDAPYNTPEFRGEVERLNIDLSTVLEAIYFHGGKDYFGRNPYARLIRDADKIDICRHIPTLLDIFRRSDKLIEGQKFSPEAINEYKMTGDVSNANVHTIPDGLLRISSWFNILFFESSRSLWRKFHITEQIEEELAKRNLTLPKTVYSL